MRARGLSTAVFVVSVASLSAQSLADVAKKEEERRKQAPSAGKVYTNKDLLPAPPVSTPPAGVEAKDAPKEGDAAKDKEAGAADKDADKDKEKDKDKPATGARDEKYWRDRMKSALEAADRDQTLADAMQSRINALTTDFVNRDDPAQRAVIAKDRDRALAELDRLKQAIIKDKKAITDLEEEARRAGVPPGWLR